MNDENILKIRNDLRKYIIYSRKSKYTGKGESIENQIEICKSYIKSKFDFNIKDEDIIIKQDEGFSGKNVKRPQFQEMMNLIKDNQVKMIVVYRLDRLSRNVLDFCEMYNELELYNTKFVSVSESFDTTTSMGRAMLMVTMTFAQLERETIAERIKDNMLELAKTGRWLGGNTPMGFNSEKYEKININGKKASLYKLSPIMDELEIIKNIYDKYLELKSLTMLETYLLNNNIMTRRNCNFTRWGLKKILTNPVYAVADIDMFNYFKNNNMEVYNEETEWNSCYGVISYNKTGKNKAGSVKVKDKNKWINAIGKHKGIISGNDWIEVQKILDNNKNKSYRKPLKNNSILSGILKCKYCNSLMRPKLKSTASVNGERKFNYICDLKMRSKGKKCSCPNIDGNEVDKLVVDKLKRISYPTIFLYKELVKVINDKNKFNILNKNELELLEKKYTHNLTSIDNYISRIEFVDKDLIDDIQTKIKCLKNNNKEIISKIKKIKNEDYSNKNIDKIVKNITNNYMNNFTNLDILSQRKFLKMIIDNCLTDGKDIFILLSDS